jgi:endonuclease III
MPRSPISDKPASTKTSNVKTSKAKATAIASPLASDADLLSNAVMTDILDTLYACYPVHPMGDLTKDQPYKVLVACILSLRTKDEVTIPASKRLFAVADTPQKMVTLNVEEVEKLIFPSGFYKTKARSILEFSQRLLDEYKGQVPNTIDELLKFKGVGRKTANLVVGLGFGLPAICVDVHVHRIVNRLGYLRTETPEETEWALREKLPPSHWNTINTTLVLHGQQVCKPIKPHCALCPVAERCATGRLTLV